MPQFLLNPPNPTRIAAGPIARIHARILSFLLVLSPIAAPSQQDQQPQTQDAQDADSVLTLKRIYDSAEFNGSGYSARWMNDTPDYLTWEKSENPVGGRDLVLHDAAIGDQQILVPASHLVPPGATSPLSVSSYQFSDDLSKMLLFTNTKKVWRAHTRGDYWVLDRTSHELRQLGGDAPASSMMFAKFSPDASRVAFVREHNIYVENLHSHEITALTITGSDTIIHGTFDWVYEEEFRLRDGFRWSPDGKSILHWSFNTSEVRRFPLINNTDSLYPTIQWFPYPKVGEVNAKGYARIIDIETRTVTDIHVPGDPSQHYIHYLEWPDHLDRIVVQQLNRRQNTNIIFFANPATGETEPILVEHDPSWVDQQNEILWNQDGTRFLWLSDRDGWRRPYLVSSDGNRIEPVTHDDFDLIDLLHWDTQTKWVYFIASPDNPTQRYLYRAKIGSKILERLTPEDQPGTHHYQFSPDGRYAIHTYSTFEQPPAIDLISLPEYEVVRTLEDNHELKENLDKLDSAPVEFFRVQIEGDLMIDGWCLKPADFDPERQYPLLIYVYGEPAGQTVLDRYGGKGMLWHRMLAQKGYVIMSFDNRGTPAPRGWSWRKTIYGQVGTLGPEDQAQTLRRVLEERPYLDPDRVGIWGWSGGGSSTLHALFKFPDLYQAGIAIAGVPNQRYYDTIYQERYMGLPGDHVQGFASGSSINYARDLEGDLLLIHGTGDDNVHYQGAEALINELILHGKQFQMMAYPNRSHSISEGAGTSMHLRRLMTDFLLEHLPPGGKVKP